MQETDPRWIGDNEFPALEYHPKRWLSERGSTAGLLSFGGGIRLCPGQNLALMELKVWLCHNAFLVPATVRRTKAFSASKLAFKPARTWTSIERHHRACLAWTFTSSPALNSLLQQGWLSTSSGESLPLKTATFQFPVMCSQVLIETAT